MIWTLALDIDGTLTGDRPALDRLTARLTAAHVRGRLFIVLSTGRRLEQVISGVAEEGLPEPDAVICQVGTEIYEAPLSRDSAPLEPWREQLLASYSRQEAVSFLQGVDGLRMQPPEFNTELKTSCFLDECPDPDAAAAEIERRVAAHADRYQVIWSSGRDLDILPAAAGRGKAVQYLLELRGLDHGRVVVAGDTGNDVAMFRHFDRGVVVANAQPELRRWSRPARTAMYSTPRHHAGGVEEGLDHFGVLND